MHLLFSVFFSIFFKLLIKNKCSILILLKVISDPVSWSRHQYQELILSLGCNCKLGIVAGSFSSFSAFSIELQNNNSDDTSTSCAGGNAGKCAYNNVQSWTTQDTGSERLYMTTVTQTNFI